MATKTFVTDKDGATIDAARNEVLLMGDLA